MTIYLLEDFNKYSNRILKLDDISNLQDKICGTYQNINFVENDGVSAEIILNRNILEASNPDYLMAVGSTGKETDSSWFITSATRLRTGQVKYQLRRDLLRDNWDSIKASQLFISKGYVSNSNPLFFNKESINVNEILTNYRSIRDDTLVSWLVAYVSKGAVPSENTNVIKFGNSMAIPYDAAFTTLDQAKEAISAGKQFVSWKAQSPTFVIYDTTIKLYYTVTVNLVHNTVGIVELVSPTDTEILYSFKTTVEAVRNNTSAIITAFTTNVVDSYGTTNNALSIKQSYNEKTIKIGTNYYSSTILLDETTVTKGSGYIEGTSLITSLMKAISATNMGRVYVNRLGIYTINYSLKDISTETDSLTYVNKSHTLGASYDIICCPYLGTRPEYKQDIIAAIDDGNQYVLDSDLCLDLFSNLSTYLGSSYVYDVQLLPFCPIPGLTHYVNHNPERIVINVDQIADSVILSTSKKACLICSRSFQRSFSITEVFDTYGKKSDYVTHKYKLVANNYSSELEIDPTKNGGITKLHIQMTCLPYQPYINIHPEYNYLNGIDNDDNRGLILGGSFSISQLTNAWTEYQYNNSNYSQIFESQLAYQKYQQNMNMWASGISAVPNAIGTGVSTGLLMSAVPGAGAFGAVTGGIAGAASLGAGIADLAKQNEMNAKANQYMTTQYELNIGSVKAKPSTLSKITAYNISTKVFPMIYTYTCTDTEQTMVDNYFKYNGMTINTCGKLEDYVDPTNETFVSARIIRWNDTSSTQSDYNYLNNINTELQEGVYITWQA